MRKALFAPLLVALFAVLATTADAAPADVALERYRSALEARRIGLDDQGIYFETLAGEPLLAYNVDCFFNPASVVKLATSEVALARLGPDYRFTTGFFTNGALDVESGDLVGALVLVGAGDPSFTTESAFYAARELRARGIRHVTGNIVVKGPLYCNYSMNRGAAGDVIRRVLDVERWNGGIESAFGRYQTITRQATFESVVVDGSVVVSSDTSLTGLTPLFTLRSMPLTKILKQLNNYSNNWIAHVIGAKVGGAPFVAETVTDLLALERGDIRLQTTSGLGSNAMRPKDVVSLLRDLEGRLRKINSSPVDIMPVAGRDPGTLEERYLNPGLAGAVVAKTGTLRGVSALAGYMHTRDKGVVLFAILNRGASPATFRKLQDDLVRDMFAVCGGPAPLAYHRPFGYGHLAGVAIDRAPGSIPEAHRASVEGAP
jgi:D-alanyl-D-alanine carboxypeptidase/D-alanyl-D-alanine-endopeptidase (penicillin-binding protein 4)